MDIQYRSIIPIYKKRSNWLRKVFFSIRSQSKKWFLIDRNLLNCIGSSSVSTTLQIIHYEASRATSHLGTRLTEMRMTVNEVSSHSCRILTPIIIKTYLQIGETLLHRSTHSCNMSSPLLTYASSVSGQ